MPTAIEVRGLTKSYGPVDALRGIDLDVEGGEIFALLGPNGAGKTTAVEIMEGHRTRSGGEVNVLGFDPGSGERTFKERIGIVLQTTGVERYLTVEETIEMYRGYYSHPRPAEETMALVGLADKRKARVGQLSGGQRRRLDVAVGLAGDPDLVFLDEPTTGFDPAARRNAWDMIRKLSNLGKTVFLTTHYMDEAQALADRVGIIVEGRIVAEGPPSRIGRGAEAAATRISFHLREGVVPPERLGPLTRRNGVFELTTAQPTSVLHELTEWALQQGVELEALSVSRPSLEDVYLQLAGPAQLQGAPEP